MFSAFDLCHWKCSELVEFLRWMTHQGIVVGFFCMAYAKNIKSKKYVL